MDIRFLFHSSFFLFHLYQPYKKYKNIEDSIMIILDHTRLIKNAAKIKESS